jgi:hypothetical protein
VVASLQAIGADAAADIVRRAVTVAFGDLPPPADRAERQELVRRFSGAVRDALAELDQEFFAYPDDLTTLLHAYVVARRDRIRGASGF